MASHLPLPPPGFDELSPDAQIDYVQSLWDRIAARPDQIPVPDWHREVIRQRVADQEANPAKGQPWENVRKEARSKLENRKLPGR